MKRIVILISILCTSQFMLAQRGPGRTPMQGGIENKYFNRNFLLNGDAEFGNGETVIQGNESETPATKAMNKKISTPYWLANAAGKDFFEVEQYGHTGGEFDWEYGKSRNWGQYYFRANVGNDKPVVSAWQSVSFVELSDSINAGKVAFTLSGLFGGWKNCSAQLIIHFKDRGGKEIGSDSTEIAKDSERNNNQNELVLKTKTGIVPKGAVTADVELRLLKYGETTTASTSFADNLSLVFTRAKK